MPQNIEMVTSVAGVIVFFEIFNGDFKNAKKWSSFRKDYFIFSTSGGGVQTQKWNFPFILTLP